MTDDLERRIDAVAGAVEPLDGDTLARMARAASARPRPAPSPRRPVVPAALAAAAVAAAAGAVAVVTLGDDSSGADDTGTTSLVSFPDGSAIRLLTSNVEGEPR